MKWANEQTFAASKAYCSALSLSQSHQICAANHCVVVVVVALTVVGSGEGKRSLPSPLSLLSVGFVAVVSSGELW